MENDFRFDFSYAFSLNFTTIIACCEVFVPQGHKVLHKEHKISVFPCKLNAFFANLVV